MNQGVCLLDEALNLARLEMAALEDGAYDRAVELAERRGEVTSMAWHMLEDSQADQYRTHLIELARVQDQLTELATRAHSEIRSQLQRSRLEGRRMRGYHRAVGQAPPFLGLAAPGVECQHVVHPSLHSVCCCLVTPALPIYGG